MNRHVFSFLAACLVSVTIGVASHVDTYSDSKSHGAYPRVGRTTLGVEWIPGVRLAPYVWSCDPEHTWSWQCPMDRGDRSYAYTDLDWRPTGVWEPVTLDTAVWLAPLSTGREDWSGCEIRWGATMSVRCPDGYTLEME